MSLHHPFDKAPPGHWFDGRSLAALIDPPTWERGLALYISQHVLDLDIVGSGAGWILLGQVQGSKREAYEVSIELALTLRGQVAQWDCLCECPVGTQCKHGVALMLKAAQQGLRLLGPTLAAAAGAGPDRSIEQLEADRLAAQARELQAARLQADQRMVSWLRELDHTGARAAQDGLRASGAFTPRPAPAPAEHYIYLLSLVEVSGGKPQLVLDAAVCKRKASGAWVKPRLLRQPPYRGLAVYDRASETDHEVLQLIAAMPVAGRHHYYGYATSISCRPLGRAGQLLLEQAASTGRLFVKDGQGYPGVAVRWGPARALEWGWRESTAVRSSGPSWNLYGKVADSPAQVCHNEPLLYLDAGNGECGRLQADGMTPDRLAVLFNAPALTTLAMQEHQLALLQALGPIPPPPVLQALGTLEGIVPRACLHLAPVPSEEVPAMGLILATLRFDYAGHRGWWDGAGNTVVLEGPQERLLLQRDVDSERRAVVRLTGLGLRAQAQGVFGLPAEHPQQDWLRWADEDFAVLRDAGFDLTFDESLQGWITRADTLRVQLEPQGNADNAEPGVTSPWFDLSLGMEIDGQRHNILPWLPDLIAEAAASAPDPESGLPTLPPHIYLRTLDRNGYIRLPTDTLRPWMAALLELVGDRQYDFTAESLRLSRLDALRTGAALGAGAVWDGAAALRSMVQQLRGAAALPEVALPASVLATLRPYQLQGLSWLQFLRTHGLAGILADDMGLGKTLQTLVHIQVEKDAGRLTRPALIIAPVSLMGNWQREAARFCPQLRCLVVHGKDRHGVTGSIDQHDVVIAPYSLLQRDRERWLQAPWHLVVLDEAQNIKNASTHAAQVVGALETRHRLCLSGTPMENHLGEVWSLFHVLMPGFLGSQKRFGELFRSPIEKLGNQDRLAQLRARITPFMLRRTKALVESELPPKVETTLRVELTGPQADLYETIRLGMEKTVRDALGSKGLAKSQITILDALLKLRQVCCDPHLLKLGAAKKVKGSAKLEQLMELLPEMLSEGRRILLFSQFTSMLTLIETELEKRKLRWVKLTGQSQKRDALIEQFTSGQVPLFLISLKAGGVGLNLPQADTVIHYDPWWNPAVENQATDRAHRIGQTQSVWVLKLVAQGTIEERILALQERKAALAQSIYSGAAGRKQPLFTESDLAELLRPLSAG